VSKFNSNYLKFFWPTLYLACVVLVSSWRNESSDGGPKNGLFLRVDNLLLCWKKAKTLRMLMLMLLQHKADDESKRRTKTSDDSVQLCPVFFYTSALGLLYDWNMSCWLKLTRIIRDFLFISDTVSSDLRPLCFTSSTALIILVFYNQSSKASFTLEIYVEILLGNKTF